MQSIISPKDAFKKIKDNKDLLIIDVRDKPDYKKCHIPGSIHITFNEIINPESGFLIKVQGKEIIAVCYKGGRSSTVCNSLKELGINAFSLEGGIEAWISNKLPILKHEAKRK